MATSEAVAQVPQVARREMPFRFTGSASEYFRIWIINTLLTIATLGIYSAWAKVRQKQYFYRSTWLDGASFEYLANPIPILKGRLIMAALLGVLVASQYYSLTAYFIVIGLVLLATPWFTVKALAFNARNSAYRNVRFSFLGNAGEAFGLYVGMGLINVLTCGIAYPYVQWRLTQFVATRHIYGDLPFLWETKSGAYYTTYLIFVGLMLPLYVLIGAVMGVMVYSGTLEGGTGGFDSTFIAITGLVYAYLLIPVAFLRARLANLLYGGLWIGEHALSCTQRARDVLRLYVTNAVAMIFTLGLLIPWAQIRLAKYRANHLTLHASGSLEASALTLQREPGALGDAASDLGDFDFDLGV
jgi:uncharacterized membrane protein YjgN (DUF898 family)